jgi:hypothetical protein
MAAPLLPSDDIPAIQYADRPTFHGLLGERASFAIATEEALSVADLQAIRAMLQTQPAWSDLPFIILTHWNASARYNFVAKALSDHFTNVIFMERPFHHTTFISVAKTAPKSRQRQLDARARIEALGEGDKRLRNALLAARSGTWELDLSTCDLTTSATYKAVFGDEF